jgi:hypothetical protein
MLLYITAEDLLGSDPGSRRGPRPLHRIPETLAGLYDLGLRHHVRRAAMLWPDGAAHEGVPDWKLDRLALRIAVFAREALGVEPGQPIAVFGRLGWLWPVVDFAAMGFGGAAVGLEHVLDDASLARELAKSGARVVFASDAESAKRLEALRAAGRLAGATLVAEGVSAEDGQVPLAKLLDLAANLDTPERAQAFRAASRRVAPDADALWHAGPGGLVRLTHRAAMSVVTPWLASQPAREGDVAYLEAPRASLEHRLAMAAFVGDGLTTAALGREGGTGEDVTALRPHRLVAHGTWLDAACVARRSRWPGLLDGGRGGRLLREALGGRLRTVRATSKVTAQTARALAAADIALEESN